MTVIEIQNQIHQTLMKGDTYIYPDDNKKIRVSKTQLEARDAIIAAVLKLFEEKKMLLSYPVGEKVFYTLYAPLGSEGQEISISQTTAELLAEIVNQYRASLKIEGGQVDKLRITDQDVQSICLVCTSLLAAMDTSEEKDAD